MRALNLEGRHLGSWLVGDILGHGGQGAVYRCSKEDIDGRVIRGAAKTLMANEQKDLGARERIVHELEVMRSVESLYLPRVLDSGIQSFSTPKGSVVVQYFVMELINGDNLQEELRDSGVLSEAEWWDLAHDLVHGAATLHEKGIVHADIKPPNVMRNARKSVLVDLGGASLVGLSDPGDAGAMTANWAAPEQLRRDRISPDDWGYEVDVFSIGQTLVQAATGHNPWDFTPPRASGKNISARDVLDAWVRHSELIKTTPPRLADMTEKQRDLVAQMLQYHPEDRPSSAEILEEIRSNLPENSPRLSEHAPIKPMKWKPQSSLDDSPVARPASLTKTPPQPSVQATVLSFLFGSFIGGFARYLYLDSQETWRNPATRNHYRVVAVLFTLLSFGTGYSVIAYKWWRRTSQLMYRNLFLLALFPIPLMVIGMAINPGAEEASPLQTAFILPAGFLMMGLSALAGMIPSEALHAPKKEQLKKFV